MYSTDGDTWTQGTLASNPNALYGVTFAKNKFVAVGPRATVVYSDDGITWEPGTAPTTNQFRDVAFDGNNFVAVASSPGNSDVIIYSDDGVTWQSTTSPSTDATWYGVTYGGDRFVAVANGGAIRAMWSYTGTGRALFELTTTDTTDLALMATGDTTSQGYKVTGVNVSGKKLAVDGGSYYGSDGTGNAGAATTASVPISDQILTIATDSNFDQFSPGNTVIQDAAYQPVSSAISNVDPVNIPGGWVETKQSYAGGYYSISRSGVTVYAGPYSSSANKDWSYSLDGGTTILSGGKLGNAYIKTARVGLGAGGVENFLLWYNGSTNSGPAMAPIVAGAKPVFTKKFDMGAGGRGGTAFYGIAYSAPLSLWVGLTGGGETDVGQIASQMRIFSSDFGESWTMDGNAPAKDWSDLVWHDQTSRFVALSKDGYVSHSSDGENWSTPTVISGITGDTYGLTHNTDTGTLVIILESDNQNYVRSTDGGSTWTVRTAAQANVPHLPGSQVAGVYSPELKRMVVGGIKLGGMSLDMVSSNDDGLTWEDASTGQSRAGRVAWDSVNGKFSTVHREGGSPESTYVSETGTLADIKYTELTVANATDLKYMEAGDTLADGHGTINSVNVANNTISITPVDGAFVTGTYSSFDVGSTAAGNGVMIVNGTSSDGQYRYSNDNGATWSSRTFPRDLYAYQASYINNKFVVVPSTSSSRPILSSTDGISWSQGLTLGGGNQLFNIAYHPPTDRYVATKSTGFFYLDNTLSTNMGEVAYTGGAGNGRIILCQNDRLVMSRLDGSAYSDDGGATWTPGGIGQGHWDKEGFIATDGAGTIVASNGRSTKGQFLSVSTDNGETFTQMTPSGAPTAKYGKVVYGAGSWFILTYDSDTVMTSSDGLTWTSFTVTGFVGEQRQAAYDPSTGFIFAAGASAVTSATGNGVSVSYTAGDKATVESPLKKGTGELKSVDKPNKTMTIENVSSVWVANDNGGSGTGTPSEFKVTDPLIEGIPAAPNSEPPNAADFTLHEESLADTVNLESWKPASTKLTPMIPRVFTRVKHRDNAANESEYSPWSGFDVKNAPIPDQLGYETQAITSREWRSVAYGVNLTKYVAVSDTNTSSDLITFMVLTTLHGSQLVHWR